MKRFRIGIIKDLVRQTFLLILVGIAITTSLSLVLVGQSVCAQGKQGESWEIAKKDLLNAGAEWVKTEDGVKALRHSKFVADIYIDSLLFFSNLYREDRFQGIKNENLSDLFRDKVKFLIKDINEAKSENNPLEGARLLYLGKNQDYALNAPNKASSDTDIMILEELNDSVNGKPYCVIKNDKKHYEIAIKLFPKADNEDCKLSSFSSEENDKIINSCTSCHSLLNAGKKYEKSDVAGAIVLTFIPNPR